jgi:lysine 6-dehydrogenase
VCVKDRYRYLVLGAGRQGTAAAYDLAHFGRAERVVLADRDPQAAAGAAARVNALVGQAVAEARGLDVADEAALVRALADADVALSAVPYRLNLPITRAAIAARTHLCDMGGHTDTTRAQLALDAEARAAGISLVPDCGMGPGLIVTLGVHALEQLDEPRELYLYDAGLPQYPRPPWNYEMTFSIEGLTNEMDGQAYFIRDGRLTPVDTLSEPEWIEVPGLGRLEADICSGGLSTSAWTFQGRLWRYENKVLRYPGHFAWLRAFKALGLFSQEPIEVGRSRVVPRDVYHALLAPRLVSGDPRDVCVIRARAVGQKCGSEAVAVADLVDRYDETTGFTAMERLTGWHCAVVMALQAEGALGTGALPMATLPATRILGELDRRGIHFTLATEWPEGRPWSELVGAASGSPSGR